VLLNDEFHPTTREVGFIELPLGDAAAALEAVMSPTVLRPRTVKGELGDMLSSLLPLTSVLVRRYLLVATRSRWTAYFDNGWRGTDARLPVSGVALRSKCMGMRAVANPAAWDGQKRPVRWPSVMWEVYGPEPNPILNHVRTLVAANDGGRWKFTQNGEPFPFEDLARYESPRVADRFPAVLLLSYLQNFDIELFDASFYCGPGVLLDVARPKPERMKEYATFADARAG